MAKILIIDDDELFCSGLAEAVSEEGNEVTCAYTITEGLKAAASGYFDIVFLDVVMPDGDGLAKISEIQAVPSNPEVIILTGRGTSDGAALAIKSGAWDYVQKPFSLNVIRLHLKRALQYRKERQAGKPAKALQVEGIIGNSTLMKNAFELLSDAASTDINVLITGETGTGKELFAKAIHNNSNRSGENFVVVDCAAIQGSLIESILFGYEKGAFTGANQSRDGLVAQADKGTLFLDEIAELPLSVQKVFLRVLQEHRFRPVGCKKETESNFRLISATNRNLESMVAAGEFRNDLLYRIRSHTIELPPLREHREDILPIATYHLDIICKRSGFEVKTFSPDFIEALLSYSWPGNVRELVNAIEGSVAAASTATTLFRKHLPAAIRILLVQNMDGIKDQPIDDNNNSAQENIPTLKELRGAIYSKAEKEYLQNLIRITGGDMEKACGISGLSQPRLYELLRKYGISTKA